MKTFDASLNKCADSKGFTLIELLVVIAIISLLSTVIIGYLEGSRTIARNNARNAQLLQIANALEIYQNDHRTYPISGAAGSPPVCLGYEDSETCYAGAYSGSTALKTALENYLEDDFAHRAFVSQDSADIGGIYYQCTGTTMCDQYKLSWVLEGSESACLKNAVAISIPPDIRCDYVPK